MPLHLHHAHRAELLVDALAEVVAEPPRDVFAPEIVAIPSRGIERWIAQRLSHRLGATPGHGDGVAANVRFPFPGVLIGDALARATGADPADDRWRPERLVWPLLDVVTEAMADGEGERLGPLAVHVEPSGDGRPNDRRFGAVRRVADLFDRYAVHRPAMLRAWARGEDAGPRAGDRLEERTQWQPWLWRRVRERLGVASAAERLVDATTAIAAGRTVNDDPLDLELPDRVSVFGVTALSAATLEVLSALGAGSGPSGDPRDVHVFVRHPSPAAWRAAAGVLDAWRHGQADDVTVHAAARTVLPEREHDPVAGLARDPLLAAWGRDSRELQVVVQAVATAYHDHSGMVEGVPPPLDAGASLLARLQDGVVADRPRTADVILPALSADDRSLQVHRCHGPARQVEVLRDLVLHVLAEHRDLEPRDILVQCPDIETYAPLVEAVFGTRVVTDGTDAPELRVQLADRSLTRTNPLLRVLAELLDLVEGRMSGSAVLDLCARAPVRRRFDLGEDDLATIERWMESTGVRWGLDGAHRESHGVPTAANTWRAGLDRLLAGVAVADEELRTVHGIVPEDEVEGDGVELAGRFAELLSRLGAIAATFAAPRPVGVWLDLLREALAQVAAPDRDAPWQELGVDRALEELRDTVRGTNAEAADQRLGVREIRDLLGDRLAGAPSRAAHRTGDLTVCTLVPMRSVPHEVVVWLGMDDEVFPRRTVPDGDDLLAAAPLVGDRDPRTEDRQLLLDSLLAARRRLIVLTTGHDERTGDQRPPAVPIGELLDTVDRTVVSGLVDEEGHPVAASAAITVDHPLQSSDAKRFTPAGLGVPGRPPVDAGRPFGFDREELAAARAAAGPRHDPPPFLPERLEPLDDAGRLALDDLVAFFRHPMLALLTQRLDVTFPRDGDGRSDAIPVEMAGLAGWNIGDRLLGDVVAGRDLDRAVAVLRARGELPPGDLADAVVGDVTRTVAGLLDFARQHDVPLDEAPSAEAIDVELPDGRRLVGSVGVVGDCRRAVRFARLGRKHRLEAWIELLALIAAHPDRPWRAVTLGRGRSEVKVGGDRAAASVSVLRAGSELTVRHGRRRTVVGSTLGQDDTPAAERRRLALEYLIDLVALRDRGLCGPLLLPCDTAGGYAEIAFKQGLGLTTAQPINTAKKSWSIDRFAGFSGEDLDPAHLRVLGRLSVAELLAIPPEPEEDGPDWFPEEISRLGRLSRRVWTPLLGAEEVVDA